MGTENVDVLLFADNIVLIENELGDDRSDEGGKRERALLCEIWGQEVRICGRSEVFSG